MLTTREVVRSEGYYLEVETGDLLRNVLPEPAQCKNGDAGADTDLEEFPVTARFERINSDVTLPVAEVATMAKEQFGRVVSGKLINRQTAVQPDGTLVTEEAEIT